MRMVRPFHILYFCANQEFYLKKKKKKSVPVDIILFVFNTRRIKFLLIENLQISLITQVKGVEQELDPDEEAPLTSHLEWRWNMAPCISEVLWSMLGGHALNYPHSTTEVHWVRLQSLLLVLVFAWGRILVIKLAYARNATVFILVFFFFFLVRFNLITCKML